MITLAPINIQIQKTLKERISMLKKSSGGSITDGETPKYTGPKYAIGTPMTDDKGTPPENYMMTRTPFLKMTSFVPKEGTVLSPIILMGGPLDRHGNLMGSSKNYFENVHGAQRNFEMDESGQFKKGYGWNSPGLEHSHGNPNFRPRIPLVKDVTVEYAGGGMNFSAHRTADISWTCWTWEQLQEYTPHFLQHGNTVLLEWGWSGIGALQDVQMLDIFKKITTSGLEETVFDTDKFNGDGLYGSVYEHLMEHIIRQNGNYDGILGLVTDFEYTVNDTGGFDCSTKLVASGVTMLGKKLSHDNNDKFSQLPALVKSGFVEKKKNWGNYYVDFWNWNETETTTEVELKPSHDAREVAELAPYVTFKDYMDDLFNQAVYHHIPFLNYGEDNVVFDKDVPGGSPQVMVTTFIKNYRRWKTDQGASGDFTAWNVTTTAKMTVNNVGGAKFNPSEMPSFKEKFEKSVDSSGGASGQVTTGKNANGDDTFLIGRITPTAESEGAKHVIADNNWDNPAGYEDSEHWQNRLKTSLGAYVTWGWFEDNVLTRFYGDMQTKGDGAGESEVYTEIRSIDKLVNKNGEFVWWNDDRDMIDKKQVAKPCYVPTKMINSKYLITVDTSKWIIPNPNDPILSNLDFNYDWMKAESTNSSFMMEIDQTSGDENGIGFAYGPSKLHEQGEWVKHYYDEENFQPSDELVIEDMADVAKLAKSNKDEMCIRNILFNTEYLTKKFTSKDTIKTSILDLWAEFSREYGNVYKFVLDFDEDGNRLKVREEGYTAMKLEHLLEGDKNKKLEQSSDGFPPLFVFPTWEDGSIVKSQTINAKLPDRMQQQAMYGNSTQKYGDQPLLQKSYSSLAAQAWGKLASKTISNDNNSSESEKKKQRYVDLISGKIDYPSRGNRSFGSDTADIQNHLYVGPTPPFNENLGIYEPDNNVAPENRGTVISDSIREQLTPEIKEYIEKRKAEMDGLDTGSPKLSADDKLLESMLLTAAFERISATGDSFSETKWGSQFGKNSEGEGSDKDKGTIFVKVGESNWSMFYSFRQNKELEHTEFYHYMDTYTTEDTSYYAGKTTIKTHETVETYDSAETDPIQVGHIELKKELLYTLQNLLRSDPEGILRKQRPLLPLELDLEIDGVGGVFPGNSFHSSYLPESYREETVFQCMGASHRIDSSGWTTTLTGQIRYLPVRVGIEPTVEEIVEEKQKSIPPIQRPYIPVPSDEPEMLGDEDVEDIDTSDLDIIVADEPKNEWIELLSTFKGEAWQNMVIYGFEKTTNSEGQDRWVQTGMHKPEWQPLWIYSDGSRYPHKSATIEQTAAGNPGIFKKEHGDLDRPILSKTVRRTYWDENIEAPNETGESVGYDMLHSDTLSTIY